MNPVQQRIYNTIIENLERRSVLIFTPRKMGIATLEKEIEEHIKKIKTMNKKPQIGDWHFEISSQKDYRTMERGWKIFTFALFRWRKLPDAAMLIGKENYQGVFFRFAYWVPFDHA